VVARVIKEKRLREDIMYKDIVIVSAIRTPFGRYCGSLREYDFFDLGALPMKEVISRVNVSGEQVEEVY
jgi:acetyl-CoA C-acetyltransferase